jgi:phage-related tail protein
MSESDEYSQSSGRGEAAAHDVQEDSAQLIVKLAKQVQLLRENLGKCERENRHLAAELGDTQSHLHDVAQDLDSKNGKLREASDTIQVASAGGGRFLAGALTVRRCRCRSIRSDG